MGVQEKDPLAQLSLPPGFRFFPTDEELLVQYLCRKIAGYHFSLQIIGEIDLYKFDPWVLPSKAIFGEKEWYFFSPRDRKYPNGSRPNRMAGSGYWKATGTDKLISAGGRKVGIKKALVFYIGKAPKGTKTNWIMHEYRASESRRKDGSSKLDDWVLCRIHEKSSSSAKTVSTVPNKDHSTGGESESTSHLDDVLESFPEIDDRSFALPRVNSLKAIQQDDKTGLMSLLGSGNYDWSTLAGLNPGFEFSSVGFAEQQVQTDGTTQLQVNNGGNDMYVPSLPPLCHVDSPPIGNSVEDEVQSGLETERVDHSKIANPVFFSRNSNYLTQNYSDSLDPFWIRYPNPSSGFA
ncbi:hypothetical protein Nepgr_007499 [Nepenthes gracilis]|uniref:NAC domain-containing protein n=1 Tax=Nepenthes gracilis TaxID=150966 RepID=A0AAD3S7B3_NEPGR|nr:hypothetical protein Nepgr_007499 [Nepenthes gracilis]